MNSQNKTGKNVKNASSHSTSLDPMYTQYKPSMNEFIYVPREVVYLLMAAVVVAGVAYAIIGHLIRDLAIDVVECVLGPTSDEEKVVKNDRGDAAKPSQAPLVMSLSHHNAFHVWDQDEVVVPLPMDDSPQGSPLLLAYIPSFFPTHNYSPTSHSNPSHSPNSHSNPSHSPNSHPNPTHSNSPKAHHTPTHSYSPKAHLKPSPTHSNSPKAHHTPTHSYSPKAHLKPSPTHSYSPGVSSSSPSTTSAHPTAV